MIDFSYIIDPSNACSRRSRTRSFPGTLLSLDCFREGCSRNCLRRRLQIGSLVLVVLPLPTRALDGVALDLFLFNGTLLPLDCFRDCCSWSCLRPIQQSRLFVLGAFVSFFRRRWRPAGGLIDVEGIQPQFPGGSPGAAICHNSAKCSSGRPSLECKIVWHHS
jgi:hypothetical protein